MKKIYHLVLVFIAFSCNTVEESHLYSENDKFFENGFHENGNLKYIYELGIDSMYNGSATEFYQSGQLKREFNFVNGLKDSTELEYYESGDIMSLGYWHKGQRWRGHILYYDSLKDVYFTIKNSDTVKATAPLRKVYYYYDLQNSIAYERSFDELWNIKEEKGSCIGITRYSGLKLDRLDTLLLQFYVVDPGWVEHFFTLNIYNDTGNLLESEELKYDSKSGAFHYSSAIDVEGIYKYEGICKMVDQLNDNVKIDTSMVEITVGDVPKTFKL